MEEGEETLTLQAVAALDHEIGGCNTTPTVPRIPTHDKRPRGRPQEGNLRAEEGQITHVFTMSGVSDGATPSFEPAWEHQQSVPVSPAC